MNIVQKFKKGKKAFHNGVNVLDSNPKMSKAASKKVKKAQEGTKLDLLKAIGNTANVAFNSFMQYNNSNKAIEELDKSIKYGKQSFINNNLDEDAIANQAMQQIEANTPEGVHRGVIDLLQAKEQIRNKMKDKLSNFYDSKYGNQYTQAKADLKQQGTDALSSIGNSVLNIGSSLFSYYNNKKPADNETPSTTVNVNGQIVNRENLGAYSQFMT